MDYCFYCGRTNEDVKKQLFDLIQERENSDMAKEIEIEKQVKTRYEHDLKVKDEVELLSKLVPVDLLKISILEAGRIKSSVVNEAFIKLIELLEKERIINKNDGFGNKNKSKSLEGLIAQYLGKPVSKNKISTPIKTPFDDYRRIITNKSYLKERFIYLKLDGSIDFNNNGTASKDRCRFRVFVCPICIERDLQISRNIY